MTPADGSAQLAFINACFNGLAGALAVAAYVSIRRGERKLHRALMLGAFAASVLFLVSYLTRIALYGNTPYQGDGTLRTVFYTVLLSHVLLSFLVVYLVPRSLYLGLRGQEQKHRKIARVALPIWLYVSVTGVAVYNFLY